MHEIGIDNLINIDWVNNFNGYSIEDLSNHIEEVDYVTGATFTMRSVHSHVAIIIDAHLRANR